ncbi:endolytic transglycosylase MltG [Glutamicibacter endophyticus]|uniref:endolytic transglycosylase MltG n=1 Tax=Glutamicibacter endophyticus TaxID=1522174 RepID=UPI003AEFBAF8
MGDEHNPANIPSSLPELLRRWAGGTRPGELPTPGAPEITGAPLGGADFTEAPETEHPHAEQAAAYDAEAEHAEQHPITGQMPLAETSVFTEHEPKPRRTKRRRNLVMLATVLIFALVVTGSVYFIKTIYKQFNPDDFTGPKGPVVEITVKDGWGAKIVGSVLAEKKVVASEKLFVKAVEDFVATHEEATTIHPGTYQLNTNLPAADAAEIMLDNRPDKVVYVGLKANVRLKDSLKEIAEGSGLKEKQLRELADDPQAFGLPESVPNLEGWLHPGEYRFPLETEATEILQTMVDNTKKALSEQGVEDLSEGYRYLKIASILQAEARPKDYATVAGAIDNRLSPNNRETHGLLQVDSTVIYGLDRYSLQFSQAERKDASNRYNSYVHKGLPPTPIGSPALPAIRAAINPVPNDYYYWVTVNTITGETKFARTFADHQKNQQQFRDFCSANPEAC